MSYSYLNYLNFGYVIENPTEPQGIRSTFLRIQGIKKRPQPTLQASS
ncbi:hypothetical protein IMCC3088_899 [Aequoribacter fuscus]|uniref:Uncharacterized protein n=1 Tax=Aequoribacter fuscus TaxID=2518989 RepID=F3L0H8_9GAMM|nr:hypothetical protein IMCC3088_899 [Aequoribacter fuscus]